MCSEGFVFVACIFVNMLLSFLVFHPLLSGRYLVKYQINVTGCEDNKIGSCPTHVFNMLFNSKFNLLCKCLLSSIIMYHFWTIDSRYS